MPGRNGREALRAALLRLARARTDSFTGRRRGLFMLAAFATYVTASVLAILNLPDLARGPQWELLAVVAVAGVPAAIVLNAAEYIISARVLRHRVPVASALRVSVLASAANLLPIPGSVLVRVGALTRLGTGVGSAISATAAVGVGWIGTGSVLTGLFLTARGPLAVGAGIALAGAILLGLTLLLLPAARGGGSRLIVLSQIVVVEAGSVAVKAARYWLVFEAFGFDLEVQQAVALAMAAVIATALGFFPGGLGIQEVLTAAIGPLVGQAASVSVLASSVDRIVSLAVLAVVAAALLRWTTPVPDEPDQLALAEAVELGP